MASLGGSAPGVVDGILSLVECTADMEEDSDKAHEQGQSTPLPRVIPPSQLSERCSMIPKYAIRTAKQAGDYNKITNYLILLIRKRYERGGDIANTIENQEPFNFEPSAYRTSRSLIYADTFYLIPWTLLCLQEWMMMMKTLPLHECMAMTLLLQECLYLLP